MTYHDAVFYEIKTPRLVDVNSRAAYISILFSMIGINVLCALGYKTPTAVLYNVSTSFLVFLHVLSP